ncbi:MAG: ketopantoate reductase family protein [Thermodesulfobacteriota bacterium]
MDFLVVGPGAMGCLFAASLKKAGLGVTLLDYRPDRAAEMDLSGICVQGVTGEYEIRIPATTGPLAADPDFVLICVKSNRTEAAGRTVRELVQGQPMVVTLQNGLGHVETLERIFGRGRVLGGVTSEGATLLETGQVRHAGRGETVVGPRKEPPGAADRLAEAFTRAGFQTRAVDQVRELIWGKLIVNVGINALTALTRLRNGRLPEVPGTLKVMEKAVAEAAAVAGAKGIRLPYADPLDRVIEVCRATSDNTASMLQDVLKERVTEVDYINGAITREGRALGVPSPVNETLTALVQALQETYGERIG